MSASHKCVAGCRAVWRRYLVTLSLVLFGSLSLWAYPEKGAPAPPLQFTQLLQAPPGTKADWHSLRGKVVVLEFWATWCSWCAAEIPHLNALAAALDPAKFQIISVDDEDPKVAQKFLANRRVSGWLGFDTTGGVISRYGAKARPTTVIVDANGRIAGTVDLQVLEAADLLAVAAGKGLDLKSVAAPDASAAAPAPAPPAKPFSQVSFALSKEAPGKGMWIDHLSTTCMEMHGDARFILTELYDLHMRKDRLILANPLSDETYMFHVEGTGADQEAVTPLAQAFVALALHLRVQKKTVARSVLILKTTDASKRLLVPTGWAHPGMCWYRKSDQKLTIANGNMYYLANALEDALGIPVIDETGFKDNFDAELKFAPEDADGARAALAEVLGLEMVREERPIQMLEVSPREDAGKAAGSKPAPKP
jgi:uncharacterized protein (TIGR03435 family)